LERQSQSQRCGTEGESFYRRQAMYVRAMYVVGAGEKNQTK
jgi:hypothetical protein